MESVPQALMGNVKISHSFIDLNVYFGLFSFWKVQVLSIFSFVTLMNRFCDKVSRQFELSIFSVSVAPVSASE